MRSGEWQIWNVDVDGGQLRQVTTDGGYAAIESADGQSLSSRGSIVSDCGAAPSPAAARRSVVDKVLAEQWPNWGL